MRAAQALVRMIRYSRRPRLDLCAILSCICMLGLDLLFMPKVWAIEFD